MKTIELTQAEIDVLKEMILMAAWNGNHISKQAFDPTPEQYKVLGRLNLKLD